MARLYEIFVKTIIWEVKVVKYSPRCKKISTFIFYPRLVLKCIFVSCHFHGCKTHTSFSGKFCVRNYMASPHQRYGYVVYFVTQIMLQIPQIYNLSKKFKSSPSVVQHLQCSLIVNYATRKNLQWNVNQNKTIFLNRMPLKMSQAKYQPF